MDGNKNHGVFASTLFQQYVFKKTMAHKTALVEFATHRAHTGEHALHHARKHNSISHTTIIRGPQP